MLRSRESLTMISMVVESTRISFAEVSFVGVVVLVAIKRYFTPSGET
jgi:hypothetical protein